MRPFDLEKALAGEPVVLRDGHKAFALRALNNKVEKSVIGYYVKPDGTESLVAWGDAGNIYVNFHEHDHDIIGMWEDPPKMFKTADGVELPLPLINSEDLSIGDEYYSINATLGAVTTFFHGYLYDRSRFEIGNCFASKEDAKAWSDYFRGLLKQAKEMHDN